MSNKTLRAAYEAAPQTFAPITRRIGVRDFKPINRMQLGEAPALDQVLEHGEFTHGTIAEGKEAYALATYGRIFGLTRQALINDDLDAFGRLITSFAQSARNKESDLAWATFLQNAAMGDGVALFHANHGNLTSGPGTAISVDSLGVARAKLRAQKGLDGRTYLNLRRGISSCRPARKRWPISTRRRRRRIKAHGQSIRGTADDHQRATAGRRRDSRRRRRAGIVARLVSSPRVSISPWICWRWRISTAKRVRKSKRGRALRWTACRPSADWISESSPSTGAALSRTTAPKRTAKEISA